MASEDKAVLVDLAHGRKQFGENEVLKDISLRVTKGQVVAIIGPSGSGKSTLLRCLTNLDTFNGGTLKYDDIVVCESATTELTCDSFGNEINRASDTVYTSKENIQKAKTKFGLVFQNFNLFPHYTVLKNIVEPPVLTQGRNPEEVEQEARALLAKMGLSDKADMVPCQLSGGQQQRVAIARALCMNPEVLYFDEPTSALDPELTIEVLKVIKELAAEHMTMVIVTHEMNFARDVADWIVFMDGGRVVEEGPARELICNPQQERTKAFLSNYNN